jgi:hypothetical protein
METSKVWRKAIRHILGSRKPANNHRECRVVGPHEGPTLTVAADGEDVIRLCLHHAKIWSDSDMPKSNERNLPGSDDSFRPDQDFRWCATLGTAKRIQ